MNSSASWSILLFLPYRSFAITTPLSIDEVQIRLTSPHWAAQRIAPNEDNRWLQALVNLFVGSITYSGEIADEYIKLTTPTDWMAVGRTLPLVAGAAIQQNTDPCVVTITARPPLYTFSYVLIWVGGMLVLQTQDLLGVLWPLLAVVTLVNYGLLVLGFQIRVRQLKRSLSTLLVA